MLEPKSLCCCPELALLTTLLLLAALPLAAGEMNGGLTPHDIARLRSVDDAVLSPDGKTIAYVVDVPRRPPQDEDGKAWRELHVVGTDGDSPRAFVTGERVSDVAWRPAAGSRQAEISFLAKRQGDEADTLYVISPDGGEARKFLALDRDVPKPTRTLVASALAYFILPVDLLPEAIVGAAGYAEDLVLAAAVLTRALGGELEPYAAKHWSGSQPLRKTLRDVLAAARGLVGTDLFRRLQERLAREGIDLD